MKCTHCGSAHTKKHGKDATGNQRFRCLDCRKTYLEPHALAGKQTSMADAVRVLSMLLEGMSIRATERLTGIHRDTIVSLVVLAGEQCRRFMEANIHDISTDHVECDEQWAFVAKKFKTAMRLGHDPSAPVGDSFVFTAIDRTSKLLICWHLGKRTTDDTKTFANKLATCVVGRPQISTDGYQSYREAIPAAWDGEVDFAQIRKDFVAPPRKEQSRYSPASIIRITKHDICGSPDMTAVGTSRMERMNLTTRMHNRRFTRLTNAHSKKWRNHEAMLGLTYCWYNWCRKHMTLKTTPAVAAGLATEPWTLERLLTEAAKTIAA